MTLQEFQEYNELSRQYRSLVNKGEGVPLMSLKPNQLFIFVNSNKKTLNTFIRCEMKYPFKCLYRNEETKVEYWSTDGKKRVHA